MVIALSFSFQVTFQIGEAGLPEGSIAFDPSGNPLQRHGVEAVNALASRPLVRDQARLAKHANMLGNSRTAQLKIRGQGAGSRGTGPQAVEYGSPSGVGDGSKHVFVSSRAVHNE
jgi:hypothetical protein